MNRPLVSTLTPQEIHAGASHALLRRFLKLDGQRREESVGFPLSWENEIEGALAEVAWCKMRGRFWTGMSKLRAKDGGDVEIRWTGYDDGGLILKDNDGDDDVFVLAKGKAPTFRFVGWIRGGHGKELGVRRPFGILVDAANLNVWQHQEAT